MLVKNSPIRRGFVIPFGLSLLLVLSAHIQDFLQSGLFCFFDLLFLDSVDLRLKIPQYIHIIKVTDTL